MANRLCWIQPLGTDIHAVLDAMASEHTEWIIESREPIVGRTITAVCEEPVGLQQSRWTDKPIWIPPEGGAGC